LKNCKDKQKRVDFVTDAFVKAFPSTPKQKSRAKLWASLSAGYLQHNKEDRMTRENAMLTVEKILEDLQRGQE